MSNRAHYMNIFRRLFFVFLLLPFLGQGQLLEPVKWSFSVEQGKDGEATLILKAKMEPKWHLYSQDIPEGGPIPTEFTFVKGDFYQLIGKVEEGKATLEYDPNFMMDLKYFSHEAIFRQKVKVTKPGTHTIKGELTFMTCDDHQCLPPDYVEYSFKVKGPEAEEAVVVPAEESDTSTTITEESDTSVVVEETEAEAEPQPEPKKAKDNSLLGIFLLSFLGGFAALLTPCVFPMIPLTVSFFTKQSKTRAKGISNAIIYGVSIIALYVSIGYLITVFFGPDALNAFSTNPWVNIVFFLLLVVFAISFFGAFEITLPSSWINKTDRASERGGLLGIFFMAFTLALVSFSCTGPIIGTLLFEAFSGGIKGPLVGMFGFSLALALPFALFAAFPGWLNTLPRSGGWLNSVRVVLGFIELAFALKFLSTADMVWQAGLLKREWFLVSWIAIFGMLTLYLIGAYRLPHDSKTDHIGVPRLFFTLFAFMFTIYLIPGLWGAPLKLISGFPPPPFYSEAPEGFGGKAIVSSGGGSEDGTVPKGADPAHCPFSLNCFHDYEAGLAYAKQVNKPILLDFTGWGCVNCRKMEEQVWSDPRVLEILRNEVVLISLYVDERQKLPEDQQYISDVTNKKVRTVGNLWSDFQARHYNTNSQPYYLILGHDSHEPLHEAAAYDPDIEYYISWLKKGIKIFEEQQ
jgi:thiol:disulfide interchange protein